MAGSIPVIETERLRLRGAQQDDLPHHAAMLADPEVLRFLGAQPHSREEAWRRLLTSTGLWTLFGYGYWTLERREDGAYVGQVGFGDFKRDLEPSTEGLPEMGWLLASHAHGQGYASEAVAAGLRWADRALAGLTITAIIHPENAASIRVAEKADFGQPVRTQYRDDPTLIFYRQPRT